MGAQAMTADPGPLDGPLGREIAVVDHRERSPDRISPGGAHAEPEQATLALADELGAPVSTREEIRDCQAPLELDREESRSIPAPKPGGLAARAAAPLRGILDAQVGPPVEARVATCPADGLRRPRPAPPPGLARF